MIELPADFVDQISTAGTSFLSELAPVAALIVGILLAAAVVGMLIRIFTR